MITSGLVVDGVSHGLQAHLPYNHHVVAAAVHNNRMSYVEPSAYLKSVVPPPPSSQQQSSEQQSTPEFLRPLPKPAPVNPLKAPRASSKYAAAAVVDCRPVNLTAAKEPPPPPPPVDHHVRLDDRHPYPVYGHPRLYVNASPYHHHPYSMHQPPAPYGVYTSPYAPVIPRDNRHHLMQPPQEQRYPSPPNKNGGMVVGNGASPSSSPPEQFKVPNGRDNGCNKPSSVQHQRILPPPPPALTVAVNHNNNNNIVVSAEPLPKKPRRTTPEPLPSTTTKTSNFTKGSLIRLANGNIKKVEDMRTEDFLNSVENSDLHRIDPSTVVRIEPVTDSSTVKGNIKITLSYGDQRNHQVGTDSKKTSTAACKSQQVEMESGAEHPYFVFGRGWASWSPAKTLAKYGLTCQRLQVGDVCVSLTKRTTTTTTTAAAAAAIATDSSTTAAVTTTTTTTHGKRRHQQQQQQQHHLHHHQQQQQQLHNNQNYHHHHQHHQQQQQQQQQHQHQHQQQLQLQQHHQHSAVAVQKAQQQLKLLQHAADDEKNNRNKRRWSAPDPEAAT